MLRGAGWITPHLNGVPYFDKPPLPCWLMAGAFAWLGPTEAAARLVSALSAVAVAVLTALIGTRIGSARVGLMAGLMVAASLETFLFGRMGKPDMLFVACILLGLYGFVRAYLVARPWDEAIERPTGAPRSASLLVPALVAVAAIGVGSLAALLGWVRLSPETVAVADVSARNMAAQGQAATTDFLAQFRPLFGPIAAVFLLAAAALGVAAWRRLPRLGVGALLAAMIAFLPLSVEGLTLYAKSRSVRLTASAPARSVARELPAGTTHLLAEDGGRRLYSNRR